MKIRTHLTIEVEIEEVLDEKHLTREYQSEHDERLFADVNRALLAAENVQKTTLRRSHVYFPDGDNDVILLRACPFCGQFLPVHTEECTMDPCCDAECELCEETCWRVLCDPDKGGCGVSTIWSDNREDAAEDWNRRAEHVR